MHKIVFTGTRLGLTIKQRTELTRYLQRVRVMGAVVLIHGAGVGGDDEADAIAVWLSMPRMVFPSNLTEQRVANEVLRARGGQVVFAPPAPPLERNRTMVDQAPTLLACPATGHELLRSGTWATIRYARACRREVHVFTP